MSRSIAVTFMILLASTFSASAFGDGARSEASGPDFSTRLLLRTYSPALSINPQVGYGQPLWGDTSTPWYGFARPYIIGVASPSLVEGTAGIELFPVSILGVDLRRTFTRRFAVSRNEDCDRLQCLGELNYTELSFQNFLAFRDYFTSVKWTRSFFDAVEDRTRPIYDFVASVLLSPLGENGDSFTVVVGKDLEASTSAGVLMRVADYHTSGNHQDAQYLFYKTGCGKFGFKDLEATVGFGRFASSRNVPEASAIVILNYTGARAIGFGR
jgi:hypothetical protein